MFKKFCLYLTVFVLIVSLTVTAGAASWGKSDVASVGVPVTVTVTKWVNNNDGITQRIITNDVLYAGAPWCYAIRVIVPSYTELNAKYNTTEFFSGARLTAKVKLTNASNNVSDVDIPITLTSNQQTLWFNGNNEFTIGRCVNGNYANLTGGVDVTCTVKYKSSLPMTFSAGTRTYVLSRENNTYKLFEEGYGNVAQFVCDNNWHCSKLYVYVYGARVEVFLDGYGNVAFNASGNCVSVDSGGYICTNIGKYDYMVAKTIADNLINNVLDMDYYSLLNKVLYLNDYNWAKNFGVVFEVSNHESETAVVKVYPVTTIPTTPVLEVPNTGEDMNWWKVAAYFCAMLLLATNLYYIRREKKLK